MNRDVSTTFERTKDTINEQLSVPHSKETCVLYRSLGVWFVTCQKLGSLDCVCGMDVTY
jgi:hypothetical protein